MCKKQTYRSYDHAKAVRRTLAARLRIYMCSCCRGWHLTKEV